MRRLVSLTVVLTLATGCATIASGPGETITLTSEPTGADVSVDCGAGTSALVTPARLAVARKSSDCTLTFRKEGFDKETAILEQGVNRWTWANLPIALLGVTALGMSGFSNDPDDSIRVGSGFLLAGLGGLALDRMTWRLRDHDPKTLHVRLRPSAQAATGQRHLPTTTNAAQ